MSDTNTTKKVFNLFNNKMEESLNKYIEVVIIPMIKLSIAEFFNLARDKIDEAIKELDLE